MFFGILPDVGSKRRQKGNCIEIENKIEGQDETQQKPSRKRKTRKTGLSLR